MIIQENCRVIDNRKVASCIYELTFLNPYISKKALPGQFVHIKCSQNYVPLLRRPFSIYKIKNKKQVSILYKVVGTGTTNLSHLGKDDFLDIIGPLGNGFSVPDEAKNIILVAGGIGIAPLSFLIDFILAKKVRLLDNIEVIYGVKNDISFVDIGFKEKQLKVHIISEDGSIGQKGTVLEIFKKVLSGLNLDSKRFFVCASGPNEMLKKLSGICTNRNIFAQVAYENIMACGVGACLGCVIDTVEGKKKVCRDGPVFNADQIIS